MLTYLAVILIISALAIGSVLYSSAKRRRKTLEALLDYWGKPKQGKFNFNQICNFAALTCDERKNQLSEQTLTDTNFYDAFTFVDRTTSKVGQQYFFRKLIRPSTSSEQLTEFDERVEFIRTNKEHRLAIQKELQRLSSSDAYFIVSLLKENLLTKPTWFKLALINMISFVVLAILCFKYPPLLAMALLPLIINFLIHYWNKSNTFLFTHSFPQLNILINVSERLSVAYPQFSQSVVPGSIKNLRSFKSKTSLLSFIPEGGIKDDFSQLAGYLVELAKATFLLEFFMLFEMIREVQSKKQDIKNLVTFVGEIDSAVSVASLRSGNLVLCQPQIVSHGKELLVKDIYHPLIKGCIKNDLRIENRSALITGSNMSGKTTFLRTILLNSIFAQTINTCFAAEFRSPVFQHFSSIQIDDDLLGGKSYYLQEVHVMGALVREVTPSQHNLFVLDEVFKGTNSLERISAAKAILSYLNRYNNIVIVSTHDIELAAMLADEFDQYHFTDLVEEETLRFDHKIKPGPLKTRNAIRILELSNYPQDIVSEAKSVSVALASGAKRSY
jgi:hypothetical protein